jgi:hypothetical protein
MAIVIPTTAEIAAQNVANFESELGQTIPLNDVAFYRVLSAIEAGLSTAQYKHAIDRIAQTLALTATGDDLDRIGENYGVFRKAAVANVSIINQPATNGTSIPVSLDYVSDASNLRYINDATVIAGVSGADLTVTCEIAGSDGNLTSGDTLTIGRQIAGITSTTATFVSTVTEGVDRETDEAYRRRVLTEIRTVGGGGNAADYRTWAEEVTSVFRAFPFSGAPVGPTTKLRDGDMELSTTTNWLEGNSANVTKSTSIKYEGTRSLKVFYGGTANPYAYQAAPCIIGREYTLDFWYRTDGGGRTAYFYNGSTLIWTGPNTTGFVSGTVTFTAVDPELRFGTDATGTGQGLYLDAVELTLSRSLPGDRVVYVEVIDSVDADGIAPLTVLDEVRSALTTDPETGQDRMVLGTTDEKLFVESIIRTAFDVTITGLVVDPTKETDLKASLDVTVDEYFRSVAPFVEGVDSDLDRNDIITGIKLSEIVQDTLSAFGATADTITFNKVGDSVVTRYTVDENETAKLGTITYA